MITEYTDICMFCKTPRPREADHHLVFGTRRKAAEDDGLTIPLCNNHHNMARRVDERIHGNVVAEKLSKIAGQLAYELDRVAEGMTKDEARADFMRRYDQSYL